MYTREELMAVERQKRRRILILSVVCAFLLADVIAFFLLRLKAATIVMTILLLGVPVFCSDVLIRPLADYAEHIRHTLEGPTREVEAVFLRA